MDKLVLGERLVRAREVAGMTQEGLGQAVDLDRTAISRLETGERKLSVPELVSIAAALSRPLSYFVDAPVPAVVSRRSDTALAHESTQALDIELETFAADVRTLVEMALIVPVRRPEGRTPRDHGAAERDALEYRRALGLGDGPLQDLGRTCQSLGLHVHSAFLGEGGPDGACVEVDAGPHTIGAAVVNGAAPAGRRRMTLAHELGHWLSGDAFDLRASADDERMISSFAIHFLAPRTGVQHVWNRQAHHTARDRALTVGAEFRLSWSAAVNHLRNIGLVEHPQRAALLAEEPRAGDYLRLGLSWVDELAAPYLSPGFTSACLDGYVAARLTSERTVELLRHVLAADDLPRRPVDTPERLRGSFTGHDG